MYKPAVYYTALKTSSMKKLIIVISLSLLGVFPAFRASAQADEIAQLLLNIEKLAQFKQILSDMKKGYEILRF